jgi:transposase
VICFGCHERRCAGSSRISPLSHAIARVGDRRVISGIIFTIHIGLRWRDVPKDYGVHKTIYNRFIAATVIFWINQWVMSLASDKIAKFSN